MIKVLGRVRAKSELQKFDNTDFIKIDLIVQDNNGTPFKIEFHKEKTKTLDNILLGNDVVVEYKIRGNYYEKKDSKGKPTGQKDVSNSLVAHKITVY